MPSKPDPKSSPNLSADHFGKLFLQDVALMDVRASVEFSAGAFPTAVSRPILDDEQRHRIGLEYTERGQALAIELGLRLATPSVRAQRLATWKQFIAENPQGYLYCFRGGMRSKITQKWLADAGIHYPRIEGGYKALRAYLLKQLVRLCEQGNIILLSGSTGVGKTELIKGRSSSIDLEGRALHRGSAFGKRFESQPSQIDWENQIIIDWLRCEAQSDSPVLIEAESHLIGRIHIPKVLQQAMSRAPVFRLIANTADRVARLYQDYVEYSLQHYQAHVDEPYAALYEDMLESLKRIKKKLGGVKFKQMDEHLTYATNRLRDHNDALGYHELIEMLLTEYYDNLYAPYQSKNEPREIFSGQYSEINDWLDRNLEPIQPVLSNMVHIPTTIQKKT